MAITKTNDMIEEISDLINSLSDWVKKVEKSKKPHMYVMYAMINKIYHLSFMIIPFMP